MSEEDAHGTSGSANPESFQDQTMGYLALHGTDLARALAGGAVFPRKGYYLASTLAAAGKEVREAVAAARQGRDYGVVAVIEINPRYPYTVAHIGACLRLPFHYLPLAMVSRIVFRSDEDIEEFRARASGYADVPACVLPYHVDPRLFGGLDTLGSLDQGCPAKYAGLVPPNEILEETNAIDKLAGTIIMCRASAGAGQAVGSCESVFVEACKSLTGPINVGDLVLALALQLDPAPEGTLYASLAGKIAGAIAKINPGDGFDAEAFLGDLPTIIPGGSKDAALAMEFAGWASAVLSGNLDIGDDGFADFPGRTVARALLLLLLNPDAMRLQSVGRRLGVMGPSVHMLACALAGCLTGFAGLPAVLKARDPQRYLAVPLLARSLALGASEWSLDARSLGAATSRKPSALVEGRRSLSIRVPAPPLGGGASTEYD